MSENVTTLQTQHAMLVVWGEYAQSIGLVKGIESVPLDQKSVDHRPQRKVLEFLVAVLGGLPYLKDISRSAHPLDQDLAVAKAWGQDSWADQSGVSRTMSALTVAQAAQMAEVLRQVSQPFIDREVMLALRDQGKVVYDTDLTGRPVSNSSTTYPWRWIHRSCIWSYERQHRVGLPGGAGQHAQSDLWASVAVGQTTSGRQDRLRVVGRTGSFSESADRRPPAAQNGLAGRAVGPTERSPCLSNHYLKRVIVLAGVQAQSVWLYASQSAFASFQAACDVNDVNAVAELQSPPNGDGELCTLPEEPGEFAQGVLAHSQL